MLYPAEKLLRKLRKIQRNLNDQLYLDSENHQISLVVSVGEQPLSVSFKQNWGETFYLLQELIKEGYARPIGHSHVALEPKGFYYASVQRRDRFKRIFYLLLKSIFIPIAVSAATSLTTLWLKGYFR